MKIGQIGKVFGFHFFLSKHYEYSKYYICIIIKTCGKEKVLIGKETVYYDAFQVYLPEINHIVFAVNVIEI